METLQCIREQSLSHRASQSAVRSRWPCLCTVWPSHSQWPSEQISESVSMRLPNLQHSCRLVVAKYCMTHVCQQPRFVFLRLLAFPKAKIAVEREKICEYDGHTIHKLSQRRLAATWLAPRQSDCWRMHSKVSSDLLPSYIKATGPVLEIFKMAAYAPDMPRTLSNSHIIGRCQSVLWLSYRMDSRIWR